MSQNANPEGEKGGFRSLLPPINSRRYHLLLGAVAIFILGPLGGVTAAYMNFSIGFFVGGQVLAGILGSAVTFGYGSEGKHGANYMQSMAAAVAGMGAMGVLIQAMGWLGIKEPPIWQLLLFYICTGMFGVGVGMLYTPILVDRMQLTFPSGYAVANILRALTDKELLKRSILKLGGSTLAGFAGGIYTTVALALAAKTWIGESMGKFLSGSAAKIDASGFSASTLGAGMIVGARLAIPTILVGGIGQLLVPWLSGRGIIGEHDPFRKIGMFLALGAIMGAAAVDMSIIAWQAIQRLRQKAAPPPAQEDWKKVNTKRLLAWVAGWGIAVAFTASVILHQPLGFTLFAISLVFVFLLVNGISNGITDNNPISSAFVASVILMAMLGLKDPGVGLFAASILLVCCTVGVDMQQDRSTGWRLGTNRIIQFRYQVIGIFMGAVCSVAMAKLFLSSYPVLQINTFEHPDAPGAGKWQSAMTYKLVGTLEGLAHPNRFAMTALAIGLCAGLMIELLRKLKTASPGYQRMAKGGLAGGTLDFILDAIILPSPYAAAFGAFVGWQTSLWFSIGGVIGSIMDWAKKWMAKPAGAGEELPSDMSTTSLVGGGLIAGDSLAALAAGLYGLLLLYRWPHWMQALRALLPF